MLTLHMPLVPSRHARFFHWLSCVLPILRFGVGSFMRNDATNEKRCCGGIRSASESHGHHGTQRTRLYGVDVNVIDRLGLAAKRRLVVVPDVVSASIHPTAAGDE